MVCESMASTPNIHVMPSRGRSTTAAFTLDLNDILTNHVMTNNHVIPTLTNQVMLYNRVNPTLTNHVMTIYHVIPRLTN
jgi:hypothetical protein